MALAGKTGFGPAQVALRISGTTQDIAQARLFLGHAIKTGDGLATAFKRKQGAALGIGDAFNGYETGSEIIPDQALCVQAAGQIRHQIRIIRVLDHALPKRFQIHQDQVARRRGRGGTECGFGGQIDFNQATCAPAFQFRFRQIQLFGRVPGMSLAGQHPFRQAFMHPADTSQGKYGQQARPGTRQARQTFHQTPGKQGYARQQTQQQQARQTVLLPCHGKGLGFQVDEHLRRETGTGKLHQAMEEKPHDQHQRQYQRQHRYRQPAWQQAGQQGQQYQQRTGSDQMHRLQRIPAQVLQGKMHRQQQNTDQHEQCDCGQKTKQ